MRIARVIAGLGWIWGILFGIIALSNLTSNRHEAATIFIIIALIGFGAAKALAWIIQGFAAPRR